MADSNHQPIPLDWSRLLGFDQFVRQGAQARLQDPACAKVGLKPQATVQGVQTPDFAKVGIKPRPRTWQAS